ncbi:MAG: acyltransferase [Planctomycetota bacterium]
MSEASDNQNGWKSSVTGHIPVLDGLRGLAILLVLFLHQTIMVEPQNPLDRSLDFLSHAGWSGVDLFFVLSGFLITGILFSSKGSQHYFRNFYMRRTLRIFPLYYAVVFLALIVIPNIGTMLQQLPGGPPIEPELLQEKLDRFGRVEGREWYYWTYLSNFAIATHGFKHGILDISWSLAIEEQFYLVWPIVVFLFKRETLMKLCVGIIVGALAIRLAMIFVFDATPFATYVLTPARADSLAVGAWIALWAKGGGNLAKLARRTSWFIPIGLLTIYATIVIDDIFGWNERIPSAAKWCGYLVQTVGYSAAAIGFGALLVRTAAAPDRSLLARFMLWKPMVVLGKYSYALYLFNLPIRALVRDLVMPPERWPLIAGSMVPMQIVFYAVSTLLTLFAAWVSWHLFEKQFLKLKKYFPASRPKRQDGGWPEAERQG